MATTETHGFVSNKLISDILAHLPKDPHLRAFSEQFLFAIPSRSLSYFSSGKWATFLQDRFNFFQNKVTQDLHQGVFELTTSPTNPTHKILQAVCLDANYIVITLEALFKEFGFPITKLFHPIVSVHLDQNQIVDLKRNTKDSLLVSMVYIEFETAVSGDVLADFEHRVALHLSSIQFSFQHQAQIVNRLMAVKQMISAHSFSLSEPQTEWSNLLDWLKAANFSFYGYAACNPDGTCDDQLGILSPQCLSHSITPLDSILTDHNTKHAHDKDPFQFDTIPLKSPVQRFENLMRLSLKIPAGKGYVEHIFLGLLKRSSLFVKNIETPIIHLKMKHIFEAKQMIPGSYDHTEVIRIFTSIPKFELFRLSSEDLHKMVEEMLSITNPNQVYCFSTTHGVKLQLLIVIPHALFSKPNINLIAEYLRQKFSHEIYEILEIRGDEKSRLHVHFELDAPVNVDCATLESEIRDLIKPWEESLKDALRQAYPGAEGVSLSEKYAHEFPSHYKVIRDAEAALKDIAYIEKITDANRVELSLVPFEFPNSALSGKASILSIYSRTKIDLMTVMPILQNLGFHVFDEITTSVGPQKASYGYIHSFRVIDEDGNKINESEFSSLLGSILKAIFEERTLNDALNRLILKASLDYRKIQMLQAYRNYLLQLGTGQTREKITSSLVNYPQCAKLFADYFHAKFSPEPALTFEERQVTLVKLEKKFSDYLISVDEVSDDLVLKAIFNLLQASLRTNYYIPKSNGETFLSFKLDSHKVQGMPLPVPYREIFVYDVGVEGIHLRFGAVARGGLRWSDRPDDFRTEVLSLGKTQQVKNVVIVPVGSKGGFVLRRKITSKEMAATESVKQYRHFVAALLDITDNIDPAGKVIAPGHVVSYDSEDPYLVVAADKGTANFSDIANEISDDFHFWLGDAFASGGSVGYNHKKEAITARGAWECTKLHFKELGKDIMAESITVAGIGDMSGDVFGNGMLLGKMIKLQAAFNHAHIFLDPDPTPDTSFAERQRLFDLPRSTWQDYNASLISEGGGIFERKAKEIKLSAPVKKMLDVKQDTMTGEQLIRTILRMQVDLLWFGGIGTYIKSSDEIHSQVGDPPNDAVRIDATACRALVITEGANLGVTQRARIEFNRRNGHLNTDAIDNSAGVNMSDYEVNIKILLKRMLSEGQLATIEERNQLLEQATDQVSELVLANNRGQHRLISTDIIRSETQFQLFSNLLQSYVSDGIIDAATENLPSAADLEHLALSRQPFSRPVLAVIQAYVKMQVYQALVEDPLLEDPYLYPFYQSYFPKVFLDRFGDQIQKHHLKHPIMATLLTNKIVNQAGTTFYFQCQNITNKSIGEITKAYLFVDAIVGASNFRAQLFQEARAQESLYQALIKLEQVIQNLVIALLQLPTPLEFSQIADYAKTLDFLKDHLQPRDFKQRHAHWMQQGFKEETAKFLASLGGLDLATDIIFLHYQEKMAIPNALGVAQAVDQVFHFGWLKIELQRLDLTHHEEIELRNSALAILQHKKTIVLKGMLTADLGATLGRKDASQRDMVRMVKQTLEFGSLDHYLKQINDLVHHNIPSNLISLSVALNRLEV